MSKSDAEKILDAANSLRNAGKTVDAFAVTVPAYDSEGVQNIFGDPSRDVVKNFLNEARSEKEARKEAMEWLKRLGLELPEKEINFLLTTQK